MTSVDWRSYYCCMAVLRRTNTSKDLLRLLEQCYAEQKSCEIAGLTDERKHHAIRQLAFLRPTTALLILSDNYEIRKIKDEFFRTFSANSNTLYWDPICYLTESPLAKLLTVKDGRYDKVELLMLADEVENGDELRRLEYHYEGCMAVESISHSIKNRAT